ncbi:MAG: PaaI family thioesterase [Bacteroidales bacterium]|nr:PaaI family thioesterase [Bacteroidales bacterium]
MEQRRFSPSMSVDVINKELADSLIGNLKIQIVRVGDGIVEAVMPVCRSTCRPDGCLHGGASLALAETVAGLGSFLLVDADCDVRGIQVSASHTGTLSDGLAYATATVIHRGRTTHIWNVDVKTSDGRLLSTSRVTNMILRKK